MRDERVVQAHPAGHEAARLGVIDAVDQAHELAHDILVVPGRTKRVLHHQPALREDDEIHIGGARPIRGRRQDGVDRGIRVVEQGGADRRKPPQVVLARRKIAVPGDHVERRLCDVGLVELAARFHVELARLLDVLVGGAGIEKVARIGQTVGADRPALRQIEIGAVILADVTARGAIEQVDGKLEAARDDADLAGRDLEHTALGSQPQAIELGDDQQLAVGVVEVLVLHRLGREIDMARHAELQEDIAAGRDGAKAGQEVERLVRNRNRVPAQLPDRKIAFIPARRGADKAPIDLDEATGVQRRRPDAIEPGAAIGCARRREGGPAQLLGIEAVGRSLRRVAPDRERAFERLGLVGAEEAGLIGRASRRGRRHRAAGAGLIEHVSLP